MSKNKIDAAKIKLLHVARRQLGLAEEEYRAILLRYGGVESSRDLGNDGFKRVMDRFAELGFKSWARQRNLGDRDGMATAGEVHKMRQLWKQYTDGQGDDKTMGKWLDHIFGVAALRFVTAEMAPRVITALKAMVKKKQPSLPPGSSAA